MGSDLGAAWQAFSRDMNADGQFTIADVWQWLVHAYFLPGDAAIWALLRFAPGSAHFLELGGRSYGGFVSGVLSGLLWFVAIIVAGAAWTLIGNFDRAVTSRVLAYRREIARSARSARHRLAGAARIYRRREKRAANAPEGMGALPKLNSLEHKVLNAHAKLGPGYTLGIAELAADLGIRRAQAERLVARLEKLGLLSKGFGDSEEGTGYLLSSPGQFFVTSHGHGAD
jgi:DNA-binding MarR family transcriptional regulator